jgi:hypothetical protein
MVTSAAPHPRQAANAGERAEGACRGGLGRAPPGGDLRPVPSPLGRRGSGDGADPGRVVYPPLPERARTGRRADRRRGVDEEQVQDVAEVCGNHRDRAGRCARRRCVRARSGPAHDRRGTRGASVCTAALGIYIDGTKYPLAWLRVRPGTPLSSPTGSPAREGMAPTITLGVPSFLVRRHARPMPQGHAFRLLTVLGVVERWPGWGHATAGVVGSGWRGSPEPMHAPGVLLVPRCRTPGQVLLVPRITGRPASFGWCPALQLRRRRPVGLHPGIARAMPSLLGRAR